MKIVICNNLYPPYARGGAESVVSQQAKALQKSGHDVVVLTTQPLSLATMTNKTVTDEDGITVYRYTPLNIISYVNLHKLPFFLRIFWHLFDLIDVASFFFARGLLAQLQPDLVYTHNPKGMGMPIVRAMHLAKRHVHVLHDVQLITPSGLLWYGKEFSWHMKGVLANLYRWMTRRLFSRVQEVQAPSQWIIDFHNTYNFFAQAHIELDRPESPADQPPTTTHPKRYLFVGQLESHKGIAFLLDVFTQARTVRPEISLTVVGDGAQYQALNKQFESYSAITFVGRVTSKEVQKWYQRSDALVVPSLCYENSPTVIAEAHRQRLQVLASNLGGIPELLTKHDHALPAGDAQAWKQALCI